MIKKKNIIELINNIEIDCKSFNYILYIFIFIFIIFIWLLYATILIVKCLSKWKWKREQNISIKGCGDKFVLI